MVRKKIPLVIAQPYTFPIMDLKYQKKWDIPEEVVIERINKNIQRLWKLLINAWKLT